MKKVVLNEQALTGITVYESAPVGSIMAYGGTSIPVGYLSCNGQAISRTDYADLFSKIGTTYGSGDGTSTFNVPSISSSVEGVTQIIKATNNVPLTSNAIDDSKTTVGNTWSAAEINKRNSYSTEEVVIGEFLGKPLYRRVINHSDIVINNSWTTIPFDVSYVKDMVRLVGMNSNGALNQALSYQSGTWSAPQGTIVENRTILEYTKTTD